MAKLAFASIDVFPEGGAYPVIQDRGFGWVDLPGESFGYGFVSRDSRGFPTIEFQKEVGALPRAFINFKDTLLADWTVTPAGDWEESQPDSGIDQFKRLVMFNTNPGVQYTATSKYAIPANVDLAFTLAMRKTPGDWDQTTFPVYTRIELAGKWGVHFEKGQVLLVKWQSSQWQIVKDLNNAGVPDGAEFSVFIRKNRGRIGVSLDFGKTYVWHEEASPINVPSGTVVVRGQGNVIVFGFHQIELKSGDYTSPTKNTLTSRISATADITGMFESVALNSVEFFDESDQPAQSAAYRFRLNPKAIAGAPFTFYQGPSVQHVRYKLPFENDPMSGAGIATQPWDDDLYAIDIEKPFELDGATCKIRLKTDAVNTFDDENYRFRTVRVNVGEYEEEDPEDFEEWVAFTGQIVGIETIWDDEFSCVAIEIEVHNISCSLKRTEWVANHDDFLLSDQTINEAADFIISSEGYEAAHRSWHASGSQYLDPGLAENPLERTKPKESKWATLKRIFGTIGLEPVPLDDGTFMSVPFDYVRPVVKNLYAVPPADDTDIREQILRIRTRIDYAESVTAVIVFGTGINGGGLVAYAVDAAAENLSLAAVTKRFTPHRTVIQEEMQGTVTQGLLNQRCLALAVQNFPLKREPNAEFAVDPRMSHRDQVNVFGCEDALGIPEGQTHYVVSLHHSYRSRQGLGELTTTAGLQRY